MQWYSSRLHDCLVAQILREFYRIEYFQLEQSYNNHLVQLPDHFRADQKLKNIKGTDQLRLQH